jgi:hypothetical protein
MNRDDLMVYIGNYFEKHEFVDASTIQKNIYYESNKTNLIPAEKITQSLDFLVKSGWIEVVQGSVDIPCIYARFYPPQVVKALKQSRTVTVR